MKYEDLIQEQINNSLSPLLKRIEELEDKLEISLIDLKEIKEQYGISRYMINRYLEAGFLHPIGTRPIKFKRQDIIKLIEKLDTGRYLGI